MQGKLVPQPDSTNEAYKTVLILGSGQALNENMLLEREVKAKLQQKGCLIIGDGKTPLISLNYDVLRNKIDAHTKIYISAHGFIKNGVHDIERIPTKNFLKELGSLSKDNQPLNIHLISCFSGAAALDVEALPLILCW
jgi:hypothetical protein